MQHRDNLYPSLTKRRPRLPSNLSALRISAFSLLVLTFFSACRAAGTGASVQSADGDGPETTVRDFYTALADWDTAQMVNLTCTVQRNDMQSGLFWGGAFQGLASVVGLGRPKMELRDMQYALQGTDGNQAQVHVSGRLLFGAPYGSTGIKATVQLRREDGQWCFFDAAEDETEP
jgi:hypothetical protein